MRRWSSLAVLVTLAIVTLGLGCRRHRDPVHDARRIERFERNLIRHAARDSGCAPPQVQPVRIAETVWTANTCTGPIEYHLDCRSRGRRWANCRWRRIGRVEEAAAAVLSCPVQGMTQEPTQQPMVRFVNGCGRRVQMNMACNDVGCGWMAAGPASGQAGPGGQVVVVPAQ